jgi:hypothetical protein
MSALPPPRVPLAVTTSGKCRNEAIARAKAAALDWGLPYLERGRKEPLGPLLGKAEALLVFGSDGVTLCDSGGALRFSPGMAGLRIKRLDAGVLEDNLVRTAQFAPGDSVLDCTLGLAADALVAARAVGPRGQVVGLEKSLALFALISSGLKSFDFGTRSCRVDAQFEDAAVFLARQPARSFDSVLFDPMFERPRRSSPAFQMLRRYADLSPLTPEILTEARRVARQAVVVKGSRYSRDLRKLNLLPEPASPSAPVLWARVLPA